MKYGDLFQYEPLRTVVELRKSDQMDRELVSTYVVSDDMAEKLAEFVGPNLQLDTPADNKGLLVVGNYGTGKSHLMSMIAAVAENAELGELLRHDGARAALAPVAGRFQVVRVELSTSGSLRDTLCRELEYALAQRGIEYRFPPQEKVTNNKAALEEMLERFQAAFPGQGLLLIVDELLDYLRGRMTEGNAIVLDFGFLRELGEIASYVPFRFIGGVQVSLFDNPEFQFVADAIRRVQARFRQVPISKSDVQFVVAERLLRKTADQQTRIRAHLQRFTPFYEGLNERLDDFVRLFPVHPDYIDIFERITVAERREVLQTLSRAMQRLKEEPVPSDRPGLLAFDSYWDELRGNSAFRANPDIRTVVDASSALEELVEKGYPKGKDKALAQRIIHGLSVHRLSVGNIESPVGMTAEQLRDRLFLYDPLVAELGGEPAEDLRGEIETTLRLISRTVNGQFISATERDARGNLGGQFYLDVRKTVDYDAQVERRAATLGTDVLDRRYFEALTIALEQKDRPTVATGYNIWEYELVWRERNASRLGYLVLGAPNDRSTAQPPRDFYLYFLQLFQPPRFSDEKKADEVFFELTGADDAFKAALRHYAAAMDLAGSSAGNEREIYRRKADQYLKQLVRWLHEKMLEGVEVTHQGQTKKLLHWIQGKVRDRLGLAPSEMANVRDVLDLVASTCLASAFENDAPEYPRFSVLVRDETRAQAAQDALRGIRTGQPTKQAAAVLDALELLADGDRLDVGHSRYATELRDRLRAKGAGQVVNRAELIELVDGVEYFDPQRYRLEPEWVVVLLGALVHSGDLELVLPGRKFTAADLEALSMTPVTELAAFKHVAPPKELNVAVLRSLFELLGESPGLANQIAQGQDGPVQLLQARLAERVQALVRAQQQVQGGLPFWGRALLSEAEQANWREQLACAKQFLEGLQSYNTAGKLRNLKIGADEVQAQAGALALLDEVATLEKLAHDLSPLANYLAQAAMVLPQEHPWIAATKAAEQEIAAQLATPETRRQPHFRAQAEQRLTALKQEHIQAYSALHTAARLGAAESRKRAALLNDERLKQLNVLGTLPVLSPSPLTELQNRLGDLRECSALTEQQLQEAPVCPTCGYRPASEPAGVSPEVVLQNADSTMDTLLQGWTRTLRESLDDPLMQSKFELLPAEQRAAVEAFARSGDLPTRPEQHLVPGIRDVLQGLTRVVIRFDALKSALADGGAAARPDEIRERFERYLDEQLRGKPAGQVRVVLE